MKRKSNIYRCIAVFMFCLSLAGPIMQSMFDTEIIMELTEEIDFGSKEKEKESKDKEQEVKHLEETASIAFGLIKNIQHLALLANQLNVGGDYSPVPDHPPKAA